MVNYSVPFGCFMKRHFMVIVHADRKYLNPAFIRSDAVEHGWTEEYAAEQATIRACQPLLDMEDPGTFHAFCNALDARYVTGSIELTEDGWPHLQLYVKLHDSSRATTLANKIKKYMDGTTNTSRSVMVEERTHGEASCINYVHKRGKFADRDWCIHAHLEDFGTNPKPKVKSKRATNRGTLLDYIQEGLTAQEIWIRDPATYLASWRDIEHLQRSGLWGMTPSGNDEEE